MILTCDRYPKEIDGLEDRLKSRLGWGLPVVIEPPELETRVAILFSKSKQMDQELNEESAFFIAQKVRSNVRELEGALKRVIANSNFTGRPITVELIKDSSERPSCNTSKAGQRRKHPKNDSRVLQYKAQ